jgi:hypothetical protein
MSITIIRNPENGGNLFFTSGQISFSQLRRYFTDDQPGFGSQISASQLRRDTDIRKENPIVPDATHNEQISTGNNLSLSQFRNSVKRYLARQSGTDINSSYPGEPGLRMGLYDPNGRGLDFAGGGYSGRDGQGGNSTGNHTKNVQKGVLITGTCGSVQPGIAAAQLAPRITVHNFRIDVSGRIFGYGGRGSGLNGWTSISGEDGSVALNLGSTGYNNRVRVGSGAKIYGGGGGGEKGKKGNDGANGTCVERTTKSNCRDCPSCDGGWYNASDCYDGWHCSRRQICGCWGDCWWESDGNTRYRNCRKDTTVNGGTGGNGGNGGHGRGYNHGWPSSLDGSDGDLGGGYGGCGGSWEPEPKRGDQGETGGRGGDWGQDGGGTSESGQGGRPGAAIAAASGAGRYALYGTLNSRTIKGSINGTV